MKVCNRNAVGAILLALLAGASPLLPQTGSAGQKQVEEDVLMFAPAQAGVPVGGTFEKVIVRSGEGPMGPAAGPMFTFISAGGGFGGETVKGSPYSAEAVTEIEQRLADGNRISRKTTASMYRDSEGRTRRDQTLGAIGPWVVSEQMPRISTIRDPIAGVSYMLDHTHQTAHKLPLLPMPDMPPMTGQVQAKFSSALRAARVAASAAVAETEATVGSAKGQEPPGAGVRMEQFEIALPPPPGPMESGNAVWIAGAGAGRPGPGPDMESRFQNQSLGKQLVEGVEAEGTRSVFTIPAGEIGNDLPIEIVSERWYSPELQAVVLSRHNDPRSGETVYRLTNIRRSEPPRALFEVPAGYTLIDPRTTTTFEGCAAAGSPVLESQPRQCRTPDGRTFVEGSGR
ncbi:MAG TPA: hypothetical protein VIC04_08975 [Terriglobia bacterium]